MKESASGQVAGLDPQHPPFGVKPDFILQLCWFRYQGQPESAAASCVTWPELLTLSGPQFSLGGEETYRALPALMAGPLAQTWGVWRQLGQQARALCSSVLCSPPHNAAWVRTEVPVFLWGHRALERLRHLHGQERPPRKRAHTLKTGAVVLEVEQARDEIKHLQANDLRRPSGCCRGGGVGGGE